MAIDQPQPPQPEAFGLTRERLSEYENNFSWLSTRLLAVVFVLAFLVIVSKHFIGDGRGPDDFAGLLVLLILGVMALAGSFAVAFMIAFPGGMILDALWKRVQSDYAAVQMYEGAVVTFKREHAEWLKTQRSWWDRLHPQRFEQEVAAAFKKQGHRVEWTGRSGDGGVDIKLTSQNGQRVVVQCKSHEKPISPGAVRDLYGTLLHEKADEAWLMSRSGFTAGAAKFATGKPIRLLGLDHILPGLGSSLRVKRLPTMRGRR